MAHDTKISVEVRNINVTSYHDYGYEWECKLPEKVKFVAVDDDKRPW